MKVIGALGEGQLAPLLVDDEGRRLVATRPAPEALAACRSVHVVAATRRMQCDERVLGLAEYVEGQDLDDLLDAGPLNDPGSVLAQVLAGLSAARAVGVSHGALRNAAIRVGPTGVVRIVDWRGRGSDDLVALRDLVTDWADDPAPLLRQIDTYTPAATPEEVPVTLHPLTGQTLGTKKAPPPRLQVAGIASLTMLLGLAAGTLVFGGTASQTVSVTVPEATTVAVTCGEQTTRAAGNRLVLPVEPATCTVTATSATGATASGRVRVSLPGEIRCLDEGGDLTCSVP